MNKLIAFFAVTALVACSPPTRDEPDDSNPTCPAERVCGDGCCPAGQTCNAATHECVSCQRTSCVLAHAECGKVPDGCGGELDCGGCAEGACGENHLCPGSACVAKSCEELHASCGDLDDGCGHTISCGTCEGGDTCGGGGVEHACGHTDPCRADPASCAQLCPPSPAVLDFSVVELGTTSHLDLPIRNCGSIPNTISEVSPLGGTFTLEDPPPLPATLSVGATLTLHVAFTPTSAVSYSRTLTLTTPYGTTAVELRGQGHATTCSSSQKPVAHVRVVNDSADITTNPTVAVGDTVVFDATTTVFPIGTSGTFSWSIASQPGTAQLQARPQPERVALTPDRPGDYVVQVVATGSNGCASSPASVTLHATARERLEIELTWAESVGDVDLHLIGPNGTFNDGGAFTTGGTDCFYANCKSPGGHTIDWGLNGTTQADGNPANDPELTLDAMWGNGPELMRDAAPFDATYTVAAYMYCSRTQSSSSSTGYSPTSSGPVTATVKIFVDGQLANTFTKTLTQRDKWLPATITVSGGGANVTVNPLGTVTKTTARQDACTADTN